MRKGLSVFVLAAAMLAFTAGTGFASQCPSLIAQARAMLAKSKNNMHKAEVEKLINEAESLHKTGKHDASVEKANKALGMLK